MSLLEALFLGVIQGLTEFLPISSSGHLILGREWFGISAGSPEVELMFDLALHIGTVCALILYFWRDLWTYLQAGLSRSPARSTDRKMAYAIVLGCIPAGLVGLFFSDQIEAVFRGQNKIIAAFLIGFGLLMYLADYLGKKERPLGKVGFWDAILIGCAQALALMPGVSRSGSTLTMGLFLGLQREAAARFSFLMSVPITLAAAVFSFKKAREAGIPDDMIAPMIAGALASMIVGMACIAFLLAYLRTKTTLPFTVYRAIVGIASLVKFW